MYDCTKYGEQELSLMVMNDEGLYRAMRECSCESQLRDLVEEHFLYTEAQFEELVDDWRADQEEPDDSAGDDWRVDQGRDPDR